MFILKINFPNICNFSLIDWKRVCVVQRDCSRQGYNARKVNCVHIETSSLWAEFVNKNRCITVRLVYTRRLKALNFDNFYNSHYSFLWPEYFIDYFMWKMDPMSGLDIRLVFTLQPRDSTLQYKRCVHFWNNFPCNTSLSLAI